MDQERQLARDRLLVNTVARDYPGSEVSVSFPDSWQVVHRFRQMNKRLYVAGMPPSEERSRSDHFHGLSSEINRSLTTYRLYKLFEPRWTPLFQVAWDSRLGQGQIIGGGRNRVQLQPFGQAQIWKGERNAVIWECYLFEYGRERNDWRETLTTFWQAVERDAGVNRIFTQPHEPTFAEGYPEFLQTLGYAPDPDRERWWSKDRSAE